MKLAAVSVAALATIAGAGCADPAAERAREADQNRLIAEALLYRSCMEHVRQIAGECRDWRDTYDRDLATFKAAYGEHDP